MSLINCPECGKIFSDKAAACPNCGCPIKVIEKGLINNTNKVQVEEEDNCTEPENIFQNIPSSLKQNSYDEQIKPNNKRRLLGFRSNKTSHKAIACLYFVFVIVYFISNIMPDTDKYQYFGADVFKRTVQMVISTLMLISPIIILSENGFRYKLPIFKHRKMYLTVIGFVLIFYISVVISQVIKFSMSDKHQASVAAYEAAIEKERKQETNTKPTTAPEKKPTTVPTIVPEKKPMVLTTDDLLDALTENALKASETYNGQYVEVTGKLSAIDSSGKYFSITSLTDDFSFKIILCNISKEHLDTVKDFKNKQEVTVIGTITKVGEIMGYTIKVESIK